MKFRSLKHNRPLNDSKSNRILSRETSLMPTERSSAFKASEHHRQYTFYHPVRRSATLNATNKERDKSNGGDKQGGVKGICLMIGTHPQHQ
ncbi:hypothetical protein GWI33_013953 [Rhynchophorus ferrugineus]|uniref:Uncharacterized protein n=1 Tax=Rhynchophorus ferrugineus TaxID=354439 RepID=A0A834I5G5_RHYFE|nr:hypothetical protein GWI33_013953 [Rhynchophorus ferrugineus]